MTSLLEGTDRLVTRGTDIGARIDGLDDATRAARGRLDDVLVDRGALIVERAAGRLRLSATHTVVAIAGATGSGKSSTFNALTDLELSAVGVRRPTTSWATACVWGRDGADELLEWLGIPPRHQTTRDSMLDTGRRSTQVELDGVVLLDLPDHDSTEVSHHLEVDRLVVLSDVLVWVLDPQKYADAAIHDRYLAPSAEQQDVVVVVLNQIDTVPEHLRQSMLDDVRRLLDADGLDRVPVLPVSARLGTGIPELKAEIARRAAEKQSTRARLDGDVRAAAATLAEASGDGPTRVIESARVTTLDAVRRRRGRRTRRGRGRREVPAPARHPGHQVAGRQPGRHHQVRPAQAARPRSGGGRGPAQRTDPGPHSRKRPRCSAPGSTPRSARSPTTSRAGWRSRGSCRYAAPPSRASTSSVTGSTPRWPRPTSVPRCSRGGPRSCGCSSGCCCSPRSPASVGRSSSPVTGKLQDSDTPQVAGVALALVLLVGGFVAGLVLALVARLARRADGPTSGGGRRPAAAFGRQRGHPRVRRRAGRGRAGGLHAGSRRARQGTRLGRALARQASTGPCRTTFSTPLPRRLPRCRRRRRVSIQHPIEARRRSMNDTDHHPAGLAGRRRQPASGGRVQRRQLPAGVHSAAVQPAYRELVRRHHAVVHRQRLARARRQLCRVAAPRRSGRRAGATGAADLRQRQQRRGDVVRGRGDPHRP